MSTPLEKLDTVLTHFYNHRDELVLPFNIWSDMPYEEQEFYRIIQELEHDGYIDQASNYASTRVMDHMYKINMEGIRFVEAGGYAAELHRNAQANQKNEEIENLELQKLRGEVVDITNRIVDYPKVEKRSKQALGVAIIVAGYEVLKWIVELVRGSSGK